LKVLISGVLISRASAGHTHVFSLPLSICYNATDQYSCGKNAKSEALQSRYKGATRYATKFGGAPRLPSPRGFRGRGERNAKQQAGAHARHAGGF